MSGNPSLFMSDISFSGRSTPRPNEVEGLTQNLVKIIGTGIHTVNAAFTDSPVEEPSSILVNPSHD